MAETGTVRPRISPPNYAAPYRDVALALEERLQLLDDLVRVFETVPIQQTVWRTFPPDEVQATFRWGPCDCTLAMTAARME